MAENVVSLFNAWIELLKQQTQLGADVTVKLLSAIQGGVSAGAELRFQVSKTLTGSSGSQNNAAIAVPNAPAGNIAAPSGFHNHLGNKIEGSRLKSSQQAPNVWQFELTNIAADNPVAGTYVGVVLNTATGEVIAPVIINVQD